MELEFKVFSGDLAIVILSGGSLLMELEYELVLALRPIINFFGLSPLLLVEFEPLDEALLGMVLSDSTCLKFKEYLYSYKNS